MNRYKFAILILSITCLHTGVFADIAPNPIKARTISPQNQTSVRMESEKVVIDLYNDSSVVRCLFNMKNLGEKEKLQIGFPEMSFYHFQIKGVADEINKFNVKENGKAVKFNFSDSLRFNNEYRKKVEHYQIKEEWYLWETEFQKGETKTIEVQYSLPFGMLYKSNKRYFTYLLHTGANWHGTIGKAEIIINLKDIALDSISSQNPANCEISDKQLIWTFSDFEPTINHDIMVFYNSNKILYKGKKPVPPVFIINDEIEKDFDIHLMPRTEIATLEVIRNPEKNTKYPEPNNGIVKIYTKDYVVEKLDELIKAKTKTKIILPKYDVLKEKYCLLINGDEVDFSKVFGIDKKSVAKLEIINSKGEKSKIMIKLN